MVIYEKYNGIKYKILIKTECDNSNGCMWETITDRDAMIWNCPKCKKRLGLSCHTTIKKRC